MTHLIRVWTRLWAPLVLLLLQMNLQTCMGSPQQHFLVRNLEPIFREDLIHSKNRAQPGTRGSGQEFSTFNPHAGAFGSRVSPHSRLTFFFGGNAAGGQRRGQHAHRLVPAELPFDGDFHAAAETHPLFDYGYPFEPLPLLDSTYFLHSHPIHV